jgi:dinuclear metal center YbgI/SA1388 family protein
MPTKRELYGYLDSIMPKTLSCEWDNDGFMCCPDPDTEVKRILFALDATAETVDYAIANGFDTIIAHHPFIFNAQFKSFTTDDVLARKIIKAVKANVTVMSFHTRLDTVAGGVNDALADIFELTDVEKIECEGIELMRVGYLPEELDIEHFVAVVSAKLGCEHLNYATNSSKVHKLALVGGGGGSYIREAAASGADTYLSGEIGYHNLTDCKDYRINLVEAGHYFTERIALYNLSRFVTEADSSIECDFFESNVINHI